MSCLTTLTVAQGENVSLWFGIVAFPTPLFTPLHDSRSLKRRKPFSRNSQRAADTHSEVLCSNFTAIHHHHREGAEGSGHWRPEGEEMGSDMGFTLLFSPFLSPLSKVLWLPGEHTHRNTFLRLEHTFKSLFSFLQCQMFI